MSGFTAVFGGTTIAPANATFLSLVLTTNVELAWPIEQAINGNVVADTIQVDATVPGLSIDLPDARQASTGYTALFNNVGANTVTVRSATGGTILSLVSGTAWVIYLEDNTTEGGLWRIFQLGASVSVAVAAALAGPGLRAIGATLAQDIPVTSIAATPTTLIATDRAKIFNWTGGLGTLNLPTPATVGNGWYVQVRNSGSGDLTVTPPSGTIDGSANKTFAAGSSAFVLTDGINYFTLGFGTGTTGAGGFDFVEINVAGSGNFTLAGANLNRIAYRFTGVLTGNRTIIVPNAIQQYWVANSTTGAFSLYVRTAGQTPPGIEVLQNNQAIMYCDSTNVIDAESSSVSFPIPVAQGGTGAVNATVARTNLGAASLADVQANLNVFTARQTVSSASPSWDINETDAAANNRLWSVEAQGEQFRICLWDDARSAFVAFFTADRTAGVLDGLGFLGPVTTPNLSAAEVGYKGIPQNPQNPSYTAVLTDANKHLYATSTAGGTVYTIPSNAAVPYPVGTSLSWVNRSGSPVSIVITTDTLIMAGTGFTAGRALANNGWATALKIAPTVWMISGAGLT